MNPTPVSVVIPAYNVAWCIKRAIVSVLNQSLPPTEILVVNDGSTDDTAAVVREFGEAVTLIDQPNGGLSNARNTGIRHARGEWVAFLDADDYWLPEKLERQVSLLASDPELAFCSTCTRVVTPDGAEINIWHCPDQGASMLHTIFERHAAVAGSGSSVVARRELLQQAGLFDEALRSLEDIDMWMRLAALGRYGCISEPLTVILKHSESMSRNLPVMRQSALRVMHKNRDLLDPELRGAFWRACFATVLADYAKWEYRTGKKWTAVMHLLEGLIVSPFRRGRTSLSLIVAIVLGQRL